MGPHGLAMSPARIEESHPEERRALAGAGQLAANGGVAAAILYAFQARGSLGPYTQAQITLDGKLQRTKPVCFYSFSYFRTLTRVD